MTEVETQAEALLTQLEGVFEAFSGRSEEARIQQRNAKRGVAGLFRGWFTTSPTLEPEQKRFMDDAQSLGGRLAEVLDKLPDGAARQALAAHGVDCYLCRTVQGEQTPEDWLLTAAEYLCMPLLPYLTPEALTHSRDRLLARTPRKFLFPKQLELVERMEALLEDATSP